MKFKSELESFRFGHLGVALYHVGVIAFMQGACAAFVYLASEEHNVGAATLFRVISVVSLAAGLVVLGAMIDSKAFAPRCFTVLCVSFSASIAIFAVKGAIVIFFKSSISEYGTLTTTVYRWRELVVYLPVCFALTFIAAEARQKLKRKQ